MQKNTSIEFSDMSRGIRHKAYLMMNLYESKSVDDAIIFTQVVALLCVSALSFANYAFQYLFAISAVCLLLSILLIMIDKRKEAELQIAWSLIFLFPMIFAFIGLFNNPHELQFIGPNLMNSTAINQLSNSSIDEFRKTLRTMFFFVYLILHMSCAPRDPLCLVRIRFVGCLLT